MLPDRQAYYDCRGKVATMFDNMDKNELARAFLIGVAFIVVAYLFARWLMSI